MNLRNIAAASVSFATLLCNPAASQGNAPAPAQQRGIIIVGGKQGAPTPAEQAAQRPATTILVPARPTTPAPAPASPATGPTTPIGGVAAPAPGAAATNSIKTEVLICRGGELQFGSHDSAPGTATLGIIFSTPVDARGLSVAAGRSGAGLTPGTCAYRDRPWSAGEAPAVSYRTIPENTALARSYTGGAYPPASQRADARSIPEWLRNPSNYWQFDVYDSRRGYQVAVDHGLWRPEITGATALTDAGTKKPETELGRVVGVTVKPLLDGVHIDFDGPRDPDRRHQYEVVVSVAPFEPKPKIGETYPYAIAIHPVLLATTAGAYRFRATTEAHQNVAKSTLESDRPYWYEITHYSLSASRSILRTEKVRGRFRTLKQDVRVSIASIDLKDFNPYRSGDLQFEIEINPRERQSGAMGLQRLTPALQTYRVGQRREMPGARRIRLIVWGKLRSANAGDGCYEVRTNLGNADEYFAAVQGHADACIDINLVKQEFDLTALKFEQGRATIPFVAIATAGPAGSRLSFEVHGSVDVTRPL